MKIKDKVTLFSHILILHSFLVLPCQMVFKSLPHSRDHLSSANPERHEEPAHGEVERLKSRQGKSKKPEKKVDDLDRTEDGEASEKAHRASYQT